MAPESERATIKEFCHQEPFSSATCSRGTTGCEVKHPKPKEPTLTCSEVVERLAKLCDEEAAAVEHVARCASDSAAERLKEATFKYMGSVIRTQAPAILHSWRERRVQELEEAIRSYLAYHQSMIDLGGAKEPFDKQMLEVLAHMQIEVVDKCKAALAKSDEWREQIRKGAKHE